MSNADHEPDVLTLKQFCARYQMSRNTLLRLRDEGLGPEVMLVGNKRIYITRRAIVDWERRMEERSREKRTEKQQSNAAVAAA